MCERLWPCHYLIGLHVTFTYMVSLSDLELGVISSNNYIDCYCSNSNVSIMSASILIIYLYLDVDVWWCVVSGVYS